MLCGSDKRTFRRLETSEEGEETPGKGHVKRPLTTPAITSFKNKSEVWQNVKL